MSQIIFKNLGLRTISSQALTPWKKSNSLSSSINLPLASATFRNHVHKINMTMSTEKRGPFTDVLVEITPPSSQSNLINQIRSPWDIACVIDTSGSMNAEAYIMNSSGQRETHGFSISTLASSAVDTLVELMQPLDRLSLIEFNNSARIRCQSVVMNEQGKQIIREQLNNIVADGGTNLWDGLVKGLSIPGNQSLDLSSSYLNRFQSLFLLTDGQPNINPPQGIKNSFEDWCVSHGCESVVDLDMKWIVNCCDF